LTLRAGVERRSATDRDRRPLNDALLSARLVRDEGFGDLGRRIERREAAKLKRRDFTAVLRGRRADG
jgi:hypothetical protein